MQSRARILDDLAKVTTGAVSTLAGIKTEIEGMVRQQLERLLSDMDLVPRDEFDAVKAMAAKAREEQEALHKRVQTLEGRAKTKTAKRPGRGAGAKKARPRTTKRKGPAAKG
ncbi:MAG: accessory factor UbiK family protein [Rhodospirillales bacterium]|jgi:BMFP domain-containing protein YqiC|nr:accessory factor UbiK family protein [Rhodospirillales bacterium]